MSTLTLAARPRRPELSGRTAFALLSSAILSLLASSSAPTPLYAIYQRQWGFSAATITVIFGVYAVAVLASLLLVGSHSDHIGRRPVLVAALSVQTLVMVLFAFAGNLDVLLLARVLQGLATGAALGAIGAGLVDLHPVRGALANTASAMAGTATGALGSALLVQFLPSPTKLIYLVLAVVFATQAAGALALRETSPRRPGALAALKPTLAIPPRARGALLIAAPAIAAVWAVGGFYASLGPSLAAVITGSHSTLLGGVSLAVLAGTAALTILAFHRVAPHRFALIGTLLVIVGAGTVLLSLSARSTPLFFLGTVFSGAGFAGGFQGGLRTIVPLAQPGERAGLLAVVYVICYLAFGLPAIGAGFLVVHTTLTQTAHLFGAAVMVMAASTAAGMVITERRRSRLPSAGVLCQAPLAASDVA
ncbi:MAG TPA: MFS transporter [Solirubrobacteraceae bacterium]|nr:MFS transporter [Solirubrobacteraceae bacterium]